MINNLTVVTGNVHKARIISSRLPIKVAISDIHIDEIQSLDLHEVVRHKAKAAFAILQRPLLVDDTGLSVTAWKGFPGTFIKHIDTLGGPELLLTMMCGVADRRARFETALGYHDGTQIHVFTGTLDGTISTEQEGEDWGFNPVFVPEGYSHTMAYLSAHGSIYQTHRTRAVDSFCTYLQST